MNYIELRRSDGVRFLYDSDSGWEIEDQGNDRSALWVNHKEGRNMDCADSYATIRARLIEPQIINQDVSEYRAELVRQFAMRAPAEPQSWFKPTLPKEHAMDVGGDWVRDGAQYNRLRLIQWPFAWARAVLEAGEKV